MRERNGGKIRVGVVGVRRGQVFAAGAENAEMELVALCDTWESRLETVGKRLNVDTYTDYDEFLAHEMDAVIVANYIHEHAPFAVKALRAGKHVLSETLSCWSMAEGVELIRAVRRSGKVYMLGENYPFMAARQELKRLYEAGEVGEFQYGEGEYVHPHSAREYTGLAPGESHWRNWRPCTYYPTHALAPIVHITGALPVRVNALAIPYMPDETEVHKSMRRHDAASVILCRMSNGAVAKLLQVYLRGHGNYTRIHGTHGLMETLRAFDQAHVRLCKESFDKKKGQPVETIYKPDFPAHHDKAMRAGHGGGDFFVLHEFGEAIRTGARPFFDVIRGVTISVVATQAWRSALEDGKPFEIPDFTKESSLRKYAKDTWAPRPAKTEGSDVAPTALYRKGEPSAEAREYARRVWGEMGWKGQTEEPGA